MEPSSGVSFVGLLHDNNASDEDNNNNMMSDSRNNKTHEEIDFGNKHNDDDGYDDEEEEEEEEEEEDNNPYSGTNHMYASGIAAVLEERNDSVHHRYHNNNNNNNINNNNNNNNNNEDYLSSTTTANNPSHEQLKDNYSQQLFGSNYATIKTNSGNIENYSNSIASTNSNNMNNHNDKDEGYIVSYADLKNIVSNSNDSTHNLPDGATGIGDKYRFPIQIIEAGQYRNSLGKYAIGYTISFNSQLVTRRYSEFDSLRQSLCKLLPTIIIPVIPSKHPLIKYFLNPLSAENDLKTIEKRKRLLTVFLNNCYSHKEIRDCVVFAKFLNPEYTWSKVLSSPPISILPTNTLLAPPLAPTKPSPLHLLLPVPSHIVLDPQYLTAADSTIDSPKFRKYEKFLHFYYENCRTIWKISKQEKHHYEQLTKSLAELGAYYNAFSLENHIFSTYKVTELSKGIEKIGQAIDISYVSTELLFVNFQKYLEEPVCEMLQLIEESEKILKFRKLKLTQFYIIDKTIIKRNKTLKQLENMDTDLSKIEETLAKNASESRTVAKVVENLKKQKIISSSKTTDGICLPKSDPTMKSHPFLASTNSRDDMIDANGALGPTGSNNAILTSETGNGNEDDNSNTTHSSRRSSVKTVHNENSNAIINNNNVSISSADVNDKTLSPTLEAQQVSPTCDTDSNDRLNQSTNSKDTILLKQEEERKREIIKLKTELEKLRDCFELIKKDMNEVNSSIDYELVTLFAYFDEKWDYMMRVLTKCILSWIKDSLDSWKNARELVNHI